MWRHPSACAHVLHSAFEIVNIFESLNDSEDAGGGMRGDESIEGSLAFGPALFFGSDVAVSLGQGKILQTPDPSVPLSKLHSSSVFSTHAENICPDSSILQHPEGLVQRWVKG